MSANAKFVGTSTVNLTLNITKDKAFARMFGQGTPRPVGLKTVGLGYNSYCEADHYQHFFNILNLGSAYKAISTRYRAQTLT